MTEHTAKSCRGNTAVLHFQLITKEMNRPERAAVGSSHTPPGGAPGIREVEEAVNVFASLSVSVHLSFILVVVLCLEVFPEHRYFHSRE